MVNKNLFLLKMTKLISVFFIFTLGDSIKLPQWTEIKTQMTQTAPGRPTEGSGMRHALVPTPTMSTPGDFHPVQLVYRGALSNGVNPP